MYKYNQSEFESMMDELMHDFKKGCGKMEDDLKQKENMSTMEMREHLKISRAEFSRRYNIPLRTLENWESGKSKCPDYVRQLLERAVLEDCEVK